MYFRVLDLQLPCVSNLVARVEDCELEDVHDVFAKHLALSITRQTQMPISFENCPGRVVPISILEEYALLYTLCPTVHSSVRQFARLSLSPSLRTNLCSVNLLSFILRCG